MVLQAARCATTSWMVLTGWCTAGAGGATASWPTRWVWARRCSAPPWLVSGQQRRQLRDAGRHEMGKRPALGVGSNMAAPWALQSCIAWPALTCTACCTAPPPCRLPVGGAADCGALPGGGPPLHGAQLDQVSEPTGWGGRGQCTASSACRRAPLCSTHLACSTIRAAASSACRPSCRPATAATTAAAAPAAAGSSASGSPVSTPSCMWGTRRAGRCECASSAMLWGWQPFPPTGSAHAAMCRSLTAACGALCQSHLSCPDRHAQCLLPCLTALPHFTSVQRACV